jgi:hypothetical protein
VNYLLSEILDEVAALFEKAPSKYVANPQTDELRRATQAVPQTLPYFWFIFNEAPAYDKFNWAVNHATDDQLKQYGGYQGLPSALIPFNQHIYSSLGSGLGAWSNTRVGAYRPPIGAS